MRHLKRWTVLVIIGLCRRRGAESWESHPNRWLDHRRLPNDSTLRRLSRNGTDTHGCTFLADACLFVRSSVRRPKDRGFAKGGNYGGVVVGRGDGGQQNCRRRWLLLYECLPVVVTVVLYAQSTVCRAAPFSRPSHNRCSVPCLLAVVHA